VDGGVVTDVDAVYAYVAALGKPRIVPMGWEKMVRRLVADGRARIVGQRRVRYGPRNSQVHVALVAEVIR
jgi:hypothetical protein